jgi:glycerol-1-phosphate dehydrogenase [NAD(P)+]
MPLKKPKLMEFPRDVIVGKGVLDEIAELCRTISVGNHPLIVHDTKTKEIAGNRIIENLRKEKFVIEEVIVERATVTEVERVKNQALKWGVGYLIAVGGGTVIDIAKLASFGIKVPFISIPTIASHDGIASPQASIKENDDPLSLRARSPAAVLADTAVLSKAPYRMLASGCADVISNLTAILDWQLAWRLKREYYSSFAVALAETAANLLIENADFIKPGIDESAWIAVKSMIVSGVAMSVANSSRPASGAEHMFSHALDQICPGKALHGEQCGIGAIIMMYLHGGDWELIKKALLEIGAPTTARELGINKENIMNALIEAHKVRPERYSILGGEGLTEDAAFHVVKATGVC